MIVCSKFENEMKFPLLLLLLLLFSLLHKPWTFPQNKRNDISERHINLPEETPIEKSCPKDFNYITYY